jgi:hypothetical protein
MFPPTTLSTMDRPITDASSPRIPRSRWPPEPRYRTRRRRGAVGSFGSSQLSYAVADGFSFVQKASNLILELTYAIAISTGIGIYLRASRTIAAGLFLGLAIVVGVREISIVLGLISGGRWYWQPVVVIALVFGECVLLLLAARAAASSSP